MESDTLIFYDISSPIHPHSYAPNPSKSRLALSYKRMPFTTTFIDLLDIATVRKSLACPATRTFADGSPFYTLPMLRIPNADNKVIGDSFAIATYLEDTYPNSGGCLFPKDSKGTGLDYESPNKDSVFHVPITLNLGAKHADYAHFNTHVDTTFSSHIQLVADSMPFNPESADAVKASMAKRAGLPSWDVVYIRGEARAKLLAAFKANTETLASYFEVNDEGPYLEGKEANYADLIVGGWVNMMAECLPSAEWAEFRAWHGGVFGRLDTALKERCYVCT
jgi:glutathione S-transferase